MLRPTIRVDERKQVKVVVVQDGLRLIVTCLVSIDELLRDILNDGCSDPLSGMHSTVIDDCRFSRTTSSPEMNTEQVASLIRRSSARPVRMLWERLLQIAPPGNVL